MLHRPQAPGPTKENVYTYVSRHQANKDEHRNSLISGVSRRSRRWRRGVSPSRSTRLLRIVRRERFLRFFVAWEIKVEVQIWVHMNIFLLKSEPPRGPLSAGLIPQLSNNLIPLRNHTNSLMKICAQSTVLLIQPFCQIYGFGGFTTSSL